MDKYGMYIGKLYEDELKKRLTEEEFKEVVNMCFRKIQVLDWVLMPDSDFRNMLTDFIKPTPDEIKEAKRHIKNMGGYYNGYYKEDSSKEDRD